MIVKCEQCQTKFKIPDEKVTDKGVKVRCTKCGNTFRVTRDAASAGGQQATVVGPPPTQAGGAGQADPFAQFGVAPEPVHDEATRPGVYALGVEASKVPHLDLSQASTTRAAAHLPAPPRRPPTGASAPLRAPAPQGFDFGNFVPTQPEIPAASPKPAGGPSPFDFSALVPQGGGGEALDVPAPLAGEPRGLASPAAGAAAANPVADLLGDLPALDLSAAAPAAPSPRSSAPLDDEGDGFGGDLSGHSSTAESRAALFDMPAPATSDALADEAPPTAQLPAPAGAKALGKITLTRLQAAPSGPVQTARRRTVVGIVVNIALALVLVAAILAVGFVYANEGVLDSKAFSVAHLKGLAGPRADYVALDISNGLYDTRAGRPVFFVRGEVLNRGTGSARLKVRAELLDGEQLVRAQEVIAGAAPTLEELHGVATADELLAVLDKRSQRAAPVGPGASAGFFVAFFEYPTDLKSFRVRVSVSRDAEATTRK